MWAANNYMIRMVEGDFGIGLPVTVSGIDLDSADQLSFVFTGDAGEILTKTYPGGAVELTFTEEETALFPVGSYSYRLDWFRDGVFMCNIIPVGTFKVVDKA